MLIRYLKQLSHIKKLETFISGNKFERYLTDHDFTCSVLQTTRPLHYIAAKKTTEKNIQKCFKYWSFSNKVFLKNKVPQKKKKQLLSHRQKYNQFPCNLLNDYIAPLP